MLLGDGIGWDVIGEWDGERAEDESRCREEWAGSAYLLGVAL